MSVLFGNKRKASEPRLIWACNEHFLPADWPSELKYDKSNEDNIKRFAWLASKFLDHMAASLRIDRQRMRLPLHVRTKSHIKWHRDLFWKANGDGNAVDSMDGFEVRSVIVILEGQSSTMVSNESEDLEKSQPTQYACNENPQNVRQCSSARGTSTYMNPRDCHSSPTDVAGRVAGVIFFRWNIAKAKRIISIDEELYAFNKWIPPTMKTEQLCDCNITFSEHGSRITFN